MILPNRGAPSMLRPRGGRDGHDYDVATSVVTGLVDRGEQFVAVSGLGLLAPGNTGQLNDGGPSAARTALSYSKPRDEMYVFQGGS